MLLLLPPVTWPIYIPLRRRPFIPNPIILLSSVSLSRWEVRDLVSISRGGGGFRITFKVGGGGFSINFKGRWEFSITVKFEVVILYRFQGGRWRILSINKRSLYRSQC